MWAMRWPRQVRSLPDALGYSQRSVKEVEERSQKVDLENIQNADLQLPLRISAYWDTLGWIYFKMGDLAQAEGYLNSAWQLGQDGVVGDHLGQVYEKEKKLPAALHMYNLALEANPRLGRDPLAHAQPGSRSSSQETDECRGRIESDAHGQTSDNHQRNGERGL